MDRVINDEVKKPTNRSIFKRKNKGHKAWWLEHLERMDNA
jgi:hypothetical protein